MRPQSDFDAVSVLLGQGRTALDVARQTGIPRSTIRYWQVHGRHEPAALRRHTWPCGISLDQFDGPTYAYLLGMYLGDGCISTEGGTHRLRIFTDSRQPAIAAECAASIRRMLPFKEPVLYKRAESQCVEISAYWLHWPCAFPQHGPGRKHLRPIVLTSEQRRIVFASPKSFLRGLIHSDGTRFVAVEKKGSSVRHAPRHEFSNRSEGILRLFMEACEAVEVRYTRPSVKQVAIYRQASVAKLDEFVGPKS